MKKIFSIMSALAMVLSFAACGGTTNNGNNPDEKEDPNAALKISISDITPNNAAITVTPVVRNAYYFVMVVEQHDKSLTDDLTKAEGLKAYTEATFKTAVDGYDYYAEMGVTMPPFEELYLMQGSVIFSATDVLPKMAPNTEYWVIAATVDAKTRTLSSDPVKKGFKTLEKVEERPEYNAEPKNPEELSYKFTKLTMSADSATNFAWVSLQDRAGSDGYYNNCVLYINNYQLEAGSYPVSSSNAANTIVASPGADVKTQEAKPSYVALSNGKTIRRIYFVTGGSIQISYQSEEIINVTGTLTSYFGSTIEISYSGGITIQD